MSRKKSQEPQIYSVTTEKKQLILQVDACTRGLGAALIQDKGPVAFACKDLTETEQRYSNIERELLDIVFVLEKFHHYMFGRHVLIETDHKPLESISQKNESTRRSTASRTYAVACTTL